MASGLEVENMQTKNRIQLISDQQTLFDLRLQMPKESAEAASLTQRIDKLLGGLELKLTANDLTCLGSDNDSLIEAFILLSNKNLCLFFKICGWLVALVIHLFGDIRLFLRIQAF